MLKLKRLKIHKLSRVKPGTELVFNDGINVLLGINGSGKTTLLELLTAVLNGQFEKLAEHDFHLEYDCEEIGARGHVEIRSTPGSSHADPPGRPQVTWSMRIEPRNGDLVTVVFADDRLSATYRGHTWHSTEPARLDQPLIRSVVAAFALHEPSAGEIRARIHGLSAWNLARLDEATRWLEEGIRDAEFLLMETAPGEIHPAIHPFLPQDIGRSLASQLLANPNAEDFKLDHHQISCLAQSCAAFGLAGTTLQLELARRDNSDAEVSLTYLGDLRIRFVTRDGTRLRPDQLSFGQRRLFAFFYYAAIYNEVIVADELTNGMHHAMIGQCIDLIGERQAFLATQNPLLLDNLPGFESAEQARSTFILCSTERENDRERMVWRNMTAEEAQNFFGEYQVGIGHTNDILRSWGLW